MGASRFIVFDGIAGSGKTTVISWVKEWIRSQGKSIFDLAEWTQTHQDPPTFEDVRSYDVLFTFEPTKQWIGRAIRYEMSQTQHCYSGRALAHAFSLDRLIQYCRLIVPALEAGKTIIQDRSVSTSLAYQPVMPDGPTVEELLEMPGNKFALEHAPNALILTDIAPELIRERLKRADDSKGVFEDLELLKKVHERFRADWFQKLFIDRGTKIEMLDTSVSKEHMFKNIATLLETYL